MSDISLTLAHTIFRETYELREVTLDEIWKLYEALSARCGGLYMSQIEIRSVEPEVFPREYSAGWKMLEKVWLKYPDQIRYFDIRFSKHKSFGGKALVNFVSLGLRVCLQGKYGDKSLGDISVSGTNCWESQFQEYTRFVVSYWHLKRRPPTGIDLEDERILRRWERFDHQDLKQHCEGAIKAKQYDVAIRTAVTFVESNLRDKCVAMGAANAASETGADLAVTAYHKDKGCLTPPWPVAAEAANGAQLLFMGFFQYIRNAYGHNAVVMGADKGCVFECIATAEFLLRVIEKSTRRCPRL